MWNYTKCQLITKDKINNIPKEIIHFTDGIYIHFPLEINIEIYDILEEFSKYENIDELINEKSKASDVTIQIINLVEKLDINTFLIEYTVDDSECQPFVLILQFIIKDRIIHKGSLISNVSESFNLYSKTVVDYNYKNDFFLDYEDAKKKYFKYDK